MFDVTAKASAGIQIHNFRLPFLQGGNMTVCVYSREGRFWYEKNNVAAWTEMGCTEAQSPGMTLLEPTPLTFRGQLGGTYAG